MVILSTHTNNRFNDMQELTLPPVNNKFYLNTVATRQPPGRSWSRYKKLLIDTPKDADLLQRQKLWNFQKLNRGAFRSQITSLPDIPYRVHTNGSEKVSVSVQTGPFHRFNSNLRVIFPNLTSRASKILPDGDSDAEDSGDGEEQDRKDKACSPMHLNDSDLYSNDLDDDSEVDDPYYEFDSVVRKKDAGTMTDVKKNTKSTKKKDKKKRAIKDKQSKKDQQSILINTDKSKRSSSAYKNVKFKNIDVTDDATQTPDIPEIMPNVIERVEIEKIVIAEENISYLTPLPSPVQEFSTGPVPKLQSLQTEGTDLYNTEFDVGHIGHSSHRSLESLSVLDYLSYARTERPKYGDSKKEYHTDGRRDGHSKHLDADADRQWFQQIVGDKDVVDLSSYENFARVRPNPDSLSDSTTDRYVDIGRVANTVRRGGYTPRTNSELPISRTQQYLAGLAAKQEAALAAISKNKPSKKNTIGIGKSY